MRRPLLLLALSALSIGCAGEHIQLEWDGDEWGDLSLGGEPMRSVSATGDRLRVQLWVQDDGSPFAIDDETSGALNLWVDPSLPEGDHAIDHLVTFPSMTGGTGLDPRIETFPGHSAAIEAIYPSIGCFCVGNDTDIDLRVTGTVSIARTSDGGASVDVDVDAAGQFPFGAVGSGRLTGSFELSADEIAP